MYIGRYLRSGSDVPNSFSELLLNQMQSSQSSVELQDLVKANPGLLTHLEHIDKELTKEEQSENEDELIVLMHHRFLSGQDKDFIDYNLIDNNE